MKNHTKTLLHILLVTLWMIAASSIEAQDKKQCEMFPLPPNDSEYKIAGAECHRYRVALQKDEFFQVRVAQKGIDVHLSLLNERGDEMARMDSPNGDEGFEILTFIADKADVFIVQVKVLKKDVPAGNYSIRREPLKVTVEDDRRRVGLERAFMEGLDLILPLFGEDGRDVTVADKDLLTTAAAKFRYALDGWVRLKDEYMIVMTRDLFDGTAKQLDTMIQKLNSLERISKKSQKEGTELIVQSNHVGVIQTISFRPDGKVLATGSSLGEIKLWNVETGRQIRTIVAHRGVAFGRDETPEWYQSRDMAINLLERFDGGGWANTVHSVAFSPDGNTLASGSSDKTIALWDLNSQEDLKNSTPKKIIKTPVRVWFVTFNVDGSQLLSIGEDDSYRYWNVETGAELVSPPPLSTFHLPWESRDGRYSVEYSEKLNTLKLLNKDTNTIRTLDGHQAGVRRVVFDPTGKNLASCGWDRTVRIWDIEGKADAKLLGEHNSFVSSLAFSPDGKLLASGGNDRVVKIWDIQSKSKLKELSGYGEYTTPLLLVKDDTVLVAKNDNFVNIWSLKKGQKVRDLELHKGRVGLVAYNPRNDVIATTDSLSLSLTDIIVASARQLRDGIDINWRDRHKITAKDFISVKFPDSYGAFDKPLTPDYKIKLWNIKGEELNEFSGASETITALAISSDGNLIASGDGAGEICLWSTLEKNKAPMMVKPGAQGITALAFSFDGRKLVTADKSGSVRFWEITTDETPELVRLFPPIKFANLSILWLEFSLNDQGLMVLGTDEKKELTSYLYDTNTGKEMTKEDPQSYGLFFDSGRLQQAASNVADSVIPEKKNLNNFKIRSFEHGKLGLFSSQNNELMAWLVSFSNNDWAVIMPNGRFDTNKLNNPQGLNWIFPDSPFYPLSFEIFMRDYYEPRLLPRLLNCLQLNNCDREFNPLPRLAEVNRNQPKIETTAILPQKSNPELVDVKVEVSSVDGQCFSKNKYIPCESGVYDLRLYRDGQLVGRSSRTDSDVVPNSSSDGARQKFLDQWREAHSLKNKQGQSVSSKDGKQEIFFKNIKLPKRAGVSQVEFTAYAFNEDRVKSETSQPAIYKLSQPRPGAKQRAYVVTIGVDATSVPNLRLSYAPTSVRSIDTFLKDKLTANYEIVPIQLVSDKLNIDKRILPKKDTIKTVLEILSGRTVAQQLRQNIPNQEKLQTATPDDLVIIYIASHGYVDPRGTFYVMPYDLGDSDSVRKGEVTEEFLNGCLDPNAKPDTKKENCIAAPEYLQHSISSAELTDWLQSIDAGGMSLILDSCHAGGVTGPGFKPGPMGDRGFGQLSYDKGMQILAATQVENRAQDTLLTEGRSLLAYALTKKGSQIKNDQSRPFNRTIWLGEAEDEVPKLYDVYGDNKLQRQEPVFFDFARRQ